MPLITKAAADAGRPPPRVCCFLPVGVTDDVDGLRDTMAARFVGYPDLPADPAMLDREGVDSPLDIAIIGNEQDAAAWNGIRVRGREPIFIAAPIDAGEDRSRTFVALQAFLYVRCVGEPHPCTQTEPNLGGTVRMTQMRGLAIAVGVSIALALSTSGVSGAATSEPAPGVTPDSVKIGFITSKTGPAVDVGELRRRLQGSGGPCERGPGA